MPSFVFSLESVLNLRIRGEQQCQRDVAAIQKQVSDLDSQLTDVSRRTARSAAEIRACLHASSLNPTELATHARYHQFLSNQSQDLSAQLTSARAALDHAKAALNSAISQRKSLEKLRQRQHEHWLAAQQKLERRSHDDLAARL
jgi:flagellar export protein FliJ